MFLVVCSKIPYDKKLSDLIRKRVNAFEEDFVNADSDIDDSSAGKTDTNADTVQAYSQYIIEVISAFVFHSNPSVNLDAVLPAVKESAASVIRTTKYLMKVTISHTFATLPLIFHFVAGR